MIHDILLIAVSIGVAVLLARSGVLGEVLRLTGEVELLGSFIAGFFFTSIFTTAPAIAALGELGRLYDLVPVAFAGALGAVIGDLLIFRFIRDEFAAHLLELVSHRRIGHRVRVFFHRKLFRWASFFVGGLIIASPLPDELGISVLGFTKMKTSWFLLLSFAFNFIGIVLIGLVARAL